MILAAILALSAVVLVAIFALFANIPTIPTTFWATINQILPSIIEGFKFVNAFIYPQVVWPLAAACIGLQMPNYL